MVVTLILRLVERMLKRNRNAEGVEDEIVASANKLYSFGEESRYKKP